MGASRQSLQNKLIFHTTKIPVALLSDGEAKTGQSRPITIACELLLMCGVYLPVANRYLWTVKVLAVQLQTALPEACTKFFSILAARERRKRLTNVNIVNFGRSQEGLSTIGPLKLAYRVADSFNAFNLVKEFRGEQDTSERYLKKPFLASYHFIFSFRGRTKYISIPFGALLYGAR